MNSIELACNEYNSSDEYGEFTTRYEVLEEIFLKLKNIEHRIGRINSVVKDVDDSKQKGF